MGTYQTLAFCSSVCCLHFNTERRCRKMDVKICTHSCNAEGTYFAFSAVSNQAQKKILDEQFESTENSKSDHALTATALLSVFIANDTASNSKYKDKVIEVSGIVSEAALAADSIGTIRIQDSIGNFATFTMEKSQFEKMKNVKAGDTLNLKGVFSGSIFSEILGTTQINFIRTVINKN